MTMSGFYPITLVSKTREYEEVYTLRFLPGSPVPFRPGQYVHLLAPGSPPGPENVRHLSIASAHERELAFSVDLAPSSPYKVKLAALPIGGQAHVFKVKGEFVLSEPPPEQAVFLAGGLGITPVRSLVRHISAQRLAVEWRLMHVARGAYLYESEAASWGGEQVRVRRPEVATVVNRWAGQWPLADWYVSGSTRFVEGVSALVREAGVSPERLRIEDFR